MLQSFIKQLLARCHCLSLYFHRSTQVLVKTLWSGNSIFYIKCLHIYTHSTQFCTCYSTTWCTYLSQAIYFHTETNSGNKIQVQNIYISFFNISKLDFGRQKTCMCSSSLNACANGYTLKCWLFFKIIQLLMLLSFGSCRNNCIMQCVGCHLAYMCSCFYFALPLLNQVISVSQPPFKSLFPAPVFFFFLLLVERTENTLQHHTCFPQGHQCLGKYLRWAEKLDFPCLYSVTAQLATQEVFLECVCRSTPAPQKILSGFISPWQIDTRKHFACVPHFYQQNSDSLVCFVW